MLVYGRGVKWFVAAQSLSLVVAGASGAPPPLGPLPRVEPRQPTAASGRMPEMSAADFGGLGSSEMYNFAIIDYLALIAFFATIAFCGVQAMFAPRRTFCAQKSE